MKPPRIILADDHALMCEGLRAMLEPAYEIVDVVRDGREVVAATQRHAPDLVLLDLSLPGRSGLEVAAELHATMPAVKTLILTMHAERIYADEALRVGASGYVLKLARAGELRHAIAEALAGRTYITPLLTDAPRPVDAATIPRPGGEDPLTAITDRQRQVLRLLGRGRTTTEIAHELGIGVKAVEFHRSRLRRALGLNSSAALIRYAVSRGLV